MGGGARGLGLYTGNQLWLPEGPGSFIGGKVLKRKRASRNESKDVSFLETQGGKSKGRRIKGS